MLENVADGFLGLFMFFANWLSVGNDQGEIRIVAVKELRSRVELECVISFDWNDRMSDLIDAGIPLRFRIASMSDHGDTTVSLRTLLCDVGDYTYSFTDSIVHPPGDSVYHSGNYRQIYRALRAYRQVSRSFDREAKSFRVNAVLLPSKVSQLGRSVDMSDICGCGTFSTKVIRKKKSRVP